MNESVLSLVLREKSFLLMTFRAKIYHQLVCELFCKMEAIKIIDELHFYGGILTGIKKRFLINFMKGF